MLSQHWNEREALQHGYRTVKDVMSMTGRGLAFIKRDLFQPEAYIDFLKRNDLFVADCVYIFVTDDQLRNLVDDVDQDLLEEFGRGHPVFVSANKNPSSPDTMLNQAVQQIVGNGFGAICCDVINKNTHQLLNTNQVKSNREVAERIVRGCANRTGPAILATVGENNQLIAVDMRFIVLNSM